MSRLVVSYLMVTVILMGASSAWARSLKDLDECGIHGRLLKVKNSTNEMIPNGEYLQVTSMEPLQCSRWDWIFLADQEVYDRMRRILNTGTQLLIAAPEPVKLDGQLTEIKALTLRANSEAVGQFTPTLNQSQHALLVTPQTNIYTFHHELRHLGDYLTRGDKIFDILGELDLNYKDLFTIHDFVLEISAYGEQFRRMMNANRSFEFTFKNNSAFLADGNEVRKKELAKHRQYFRKNYAEPMRALIDYLHYAHPSRAQKVRRALVDLVSSDDLHATGVRDLFPELPDCEKLLL